MELVYLWVEDYKNIQSQGFNFSPRFRCEYDEKEKKLEIIDKEDTGEYYPKDIFPKNINVTAIVGENGSGKSNILELVLQNTFHTSVTLTNQPQYFCLYYSNELFYMKDINTKIQIYNYNLNKLKDDIFVIHYDNSYSKIADYNSISNSTNNIYMFPIKEEKFYSHKYKEELKNIFLSMKNSFIHSKLYNFFYPNQIFIDLNNSIQNDVKDINTYSKYMKKYIYKCYQRFELETNITNILQIQKVEENFKNWHDIKKQIDRYKKENSLTQKMMLDEFFKFDYLLRNFEKFMELFDLLSDDLLNPIEAQHSKFKDSIKRQRIYEQSKKWVINKIKLDDEAIELLINLPNSINLEIYDTSKNISLNDLSNGEKSLLHIRLYFERIIQKHLGKEFIILIDEAETDLHPQWQKQVIKYFIDSFGKHKIHFIFSSHSPFILSDIPKENVIFLKDGEQVYPDINTFGANIHTLLSNGFFMGDGLIGEFAKEKIQKAVDILNEKNPNREKKDEVQNIINIIGEPFLKNKLQDMYDTVFLDEQERQQKIKILEKNIERLKNANNRKR